MEIPEPKNQQVPSSDQERPIIVRLSQKSLFTWIFLATLGLLAVAGIAYGAYGYGKRSGQPALTPPSTGLVSSPTPKSVGNNFKLFSLKPSPLALPTTTSGGPGPEMVNLKDLIPPQMNFDYSFFIDLDGDEQQEVILVGTDKEHQAAQQAGPYVGMPLVQVYQFVPQLKVWQLRAEVNYAYFPGRGVENINASLLKDVYIVSLGNYQALALTSFVSGSRVNKWFTVIVGSDAGIKAYRFPEEIYKEQGGKLPHEVTFFGEGKVEVKEGIYQMTDANCCPSGGTLIATFIITPQGIEFKDATHQESNPTY